MPSGSTIHSGVRKVPDVMLGERLVFGCIRDPWSWYVSYYLHALNPKTGTLTGPLAQICGNKASFSDVVETLTMPTGSALHIEPKLLGEENAVNKKIGSVLASSQIGLWSWTLLSSLCDMPAEEQEIRAEPPWYADVVIDAATVEIGLAEIISQTSVDPDPSLRFLEQAAPLNESTKPWQGVRPSGRPDPRWWTAKTIANVMKVDGALLHRFGYDRPVGARPPLHVLRS